MKKIVVILIAIYLGQPAPGQTKQPSCNCPKKGFNASGKADIIFDLGQDRKLALCGSITKQKKDTLYSEYILFQCGRKEIIDATDYPSSKITQRDDSLFVTEIEGFPVGKDFEFVYIPFRGEKYFFQEAKLKTTVFYPADLPRYSANQIKTVLSQYAKLKLPMNNHDTMLLVAHRLCWAYISGSGAAERHLQEMKKKFGPFDGGIKEEFDDIWGTYLLWKHERNTP